MSSKDQAARRDLYISHYDKKQGDFIKLFEKNSKSGWPVKYTSNFKRADKKIDPEVTARMDKMWDDDDSWWGFTVDIYEPSLAKRQASTIQHEFGHVAHLVKDGPMKNSINNFLAMERPLENGWGLLVSEYAGYNNKEYIAETMALYMKGPSQFYRIHPKVLEIYRKFDNDSA